MIDSSTVQSLELIQNLQNSKSKNCLFGLMNETLTPMGSRLLKSNIIQPSTRADVLTQRYEALQELTTKEDVFVQTRQALKSIHDIEKLLSSLIIIPIKPDIRHSEQSINNILMLKKFVKTIPLLYEALGTVCSDLLSVIRENCRPENIHQTAKFIEETINEDVTYQKTPLDLRNQRTYAVKVSECLELFSRSYLKLPVWSRGTSSRDGLAIAISISEALIESKAMIWFATHFRELAQILSERPGVVNLHLAVDLSEQNTMKMLYKIGEGFVKDEHYGLSLAKIVGLPPLVLEVAERVSKALDAQAAAKKKSSKAFALARRRKLVLGLKETLKQTESGPMHGQVLFEWLRRLQEEFVCRMDNIENEARDSGDEREESAALESDEGEDSGRD
ncbi:hypothetical protein K3495_g3902 [Podosphaera aphanis]|nr:hypothetical protein K3495_g3902 [Podosphaera aphanis]